MTIEELARTDPHWQKILDQESNTPQIKLFSLISRINEAQVFVRDTIALYKANSEKMVFRKMRGVPELLSNPKFWKSGDQGPTEPSFDTLALLVSQMENSTREKVENHYPRWVLNQCLVTYCTILDSYLDSLVDNIYRQNPKILYGVSGGKNIDLKKIVTLGSVEAVIIEIRAKEVRHFSNGDIADRLRYLQSKMSIETDRLFDWEYLETEIERSLDGLNLKTLEDLYQKRHDIVHRDQTPISTLEELDIVPTFFLNIGAKLALVASQKHHVSLDMFLLTNRNERYKLLKAQAESISS